MPCGAVLMCCNAAGFLPCNAVLICCNAVIVLPRGSPRDLPRCLRFAKGFASLYSHFVFALALVFAFSFVFVFVFTCVFTGRIVSLYLHLCLLAFSFVSAFVFAFVFTGSKSTEEESAQSGFCMQKYRGREHAI